jgi:hypothetical protein
MAGPGPPYCPRCGTARIADMGFCPKCGLNLTELPDGSAPGSTAPLGSAASVEAASPLAARSSRPPGIVLGAIVVVVAVIALGLLTRFQISSTPPSNGQSIPSASLVPGAPIIGLTILSPADGQVVVTKEITVIGTAPAGLTITQDISFGFDQHAAVDSTGHWAIKVGLNEGDNKLNFRIGDDGSTRQTIRVIYTPPQTPSAHAGRRVAT